MSYDALNADQRGGAQLNGKPSFTIDQAAAQLTREGRSWSDRLGEPTVVTYAFRDTAPAQMPLDTGGFSRFDASQIHAAEYALARWSDVANIRFERVGGITGYYSNDATILFGNYASGQKDAGAFAFLPGNRSVGSVSGDVWVASHSADRLVLLHEIGHAIGLTHPSDYDTGDAVEPTYAASAAYAQDSLEYTVMSYFDGAETGARLDAAWPYPGPLLDDVAAAQRLYGANLQTNSGDTRHTEWHWGTIWDGGGTDTLDFSDFSMPLKIDLHAGAFSNIGSYVGNISIAQGVLIEDAIGGDAGDVIIGNDAANVINGRYGNDRIYGNLGADRLRGSEGDDFLDGGGGEDTAVYAYSSDRITVRVEDGALVVRSPDGVDRLVSIERLSFLDYSMAAPDPDPVVADAWYYRANPDVAAAGVDADDHYAASGWREGRDPNAFFDTSAYLDANRDVAAARLNPLDHYIASGAREGRDPSALFDNEQYLARNPDVAAAGANPLLHFLGSGQAEGRAAYAAVGSRLIVDFDPEYYRLTNADVARASADPLTHYLAFGAREGRDPSAYFDTSFYLEHNPDVAAAGANPLLHYEQYGWHEGRDPSAAFATRYYLDANPDVARAGIDPLFHYLTNGRLEGRLAHGDASSAGLDGLLI